MAKKFLVPLDGSDIAETILPLLCTLVGGHESEVILLHVVQYPSELYPSDSDYPTYDPALLETIHMKKWAILRSWQAYLEDVSTWLAKLDYKVGTEIREGPVVDAGIETEEELETDFIALATHGSSVYVSQVVSSVANRVLHEAKTTVMVIVYPKQEVFHIEPMRMHRAIIAGQSVDHS